MSTPLHGSSSDPERGKSLPHSWPVRNERVLPSGFIVDVDRPLDIQSEYTNHALGLKALIVAEITAAKQGKFHVVDGRGEPILGNSLILANANNPNQRKIIHPDEVLKIGRLHHADQFGYPNDMSPNHFTLALDSQSRELHVADKQSVRGTFLTGHILFPERIPRHLNKSVADYTDTLTNLMVEYEGYTNPTPEAPYGSYMGHPYIGRESKSVRNGIYATDVTEQMIVDDSDSYVASAVAIVIHKLHRFAASGELAREKELLNFIQNEVASLMQYKFEEVQALSAPHYNKRGVIYMSDYLRAGIGICRHQAVFAALIIEQAIDEGLLRGSIRVRRNRDTEKNNAHAWTEYRNTHGRTLIVDPTNHFAGTRAEAKYHTGGRLYPDGWDYYVSDDS